MRKLVGHEGRVQTLVFSSKGDLFSGGSDRAVVAWDLHDYSHPNPIRWKKSLHDADVSGMSIAPNDTLLASASWDGTVRVWNPQSGEDLWTIEELPDQAGSMIAVAFSSDGSELAFAGGHIAQDNPILRIQLSDRIDLPTLQGSQSQIGCLAYAPVVRSGQKSFFASGAADKKVRLWDLTNASEYHALSHRGWIQSIAFSPDGRYLATAGGRMIRPWELIYPQANAGLKSTLPIPKEIHQFKAHRHTVQSLAFSPNSRFLAACSRDGSLSLWDADTGQVVRRIDAKFGELHALAFAPDGAVLAVGGERGTIALWDMDE